MTQDLIWEQYPYPVALKMLLEGNSPEIIFNATPVTQLKPPEQPHDDVWINKTGSTNGFGAYVAFVPEKRLGIVLLSNKNYPIADRVTAAYQILCHLLTEKVKMVNCARVFAYLMPNQTMQRTADRPYV